MENNTPHSHTAMRPATAQRLLTEARRIGSANGYGSDFRYELVLHEAGGYVSIRSASGRVEAARIPVTITANLVNKIIRLT